MTLIVATIILGATIAATPVILQAAVIRHSGTHVNGATYQLGITAGTLTDRMPAAENLQQEMPDTPFVGQARQLR